MIRMLIVGYCFGIRSERRLCEEVHLNLAYRWFCRLGLEISCRTTRRSPRTGMVAFGTAKPFAICSKASFSAAWLKGWCAETSSGFGAFGINHIAILRKFCAVAARRTHLAHH